MVSAFVGSDCVAVVAGNFVADFVAAPYSSGHPLAVVAAVGSADPVAAFDSFAAGASFPLFQEFADLSVRQDLHIPVLLLWVWMM